MIFTYPDAKQIVVCGDIHGEFETLVYKVCEQYKMSDTLIVVAGDCGFGFEKPAHYDQIYNHLSNRLNDKNNWIVMIRGNHDDPAYFQGQLIKAKHWQTIPDYSIVEACGHSILCVGGAISIDRLWRLQAMARSNGRQYYWNDEMPTYNEQLLDEITKSNIKIDTVITHTAPSFCELITKNGLASWATQDPELTDDCAKEREVMDKINKFLKDNKHPLNRWYYGHFHQSWYSNIDGTLYTMLDIMELKKIY